ncbi:MAG: hypothetical protein LBM02_08035 [Lachnospiraceae bacterium]|jgi:hypothetical protein|nr:hypothetical protein [Lachnospiraceae bacterium]
MTDEENLIEKSKERILNKLNNCSKLRTLIPFIQTSNVSANIKANVICNVGNINLITQTVDYSDFNFVCGNAIAKMISTENESIVNYLIDNVDQTIINSDDLEEKLLSHYGDTIILINPQMVKLIPNAIKIHKNIYFMNEIENNVICIDNKDSDFSIKEQFTFSMAKTEFGILSDKELKIGESTKLKNYRLE